MTNTILNITFTNGEVETFEFANKKDALKAVKYIEKTWEEKIATYSIQ